MERSEGLRLAVQEALRARAVCGAGERAVERGVEPAAPCGVRGFEGGRLRREAGAADCEFCGCAETPALFAASSREERKVRSAAASPTGETMCKGACLESSRRGDNVADSVQGSLS